MDRATYSAAADVVLDKSQDKPIPCGRSKQLESNALHPRFVSVAMLMLRNA